MYSFYTKYDIHYGTEVILFEICLKYIQTKMNSEWNYFCPLIVSIFVSTFLILNVKLIMEQRQYYSKCVQNVSKLKVYLSKQKWTINESLIFFKIILLALSTLIPWNFLLVELPLKFLLDDIKLHIYIRFNILHLLKSYLLKWIFSLGNKKESNWARSKYRGCCTCTILCFAQNYSSESFETSHNFFPNCHWIV